MPARAIVPRKISATSARSGGPAGAALAAAAGYLLGTVPSADIATRLATGGTTNIRDAGTGNPGALNTGKTLGSKWGAGVMVADIAKGFVAARVGNRLAGGVGANTAATAAVVGHCLPVWNNFRGGKGVATSVGQVLGTFPPYFPLDFAVAAATVAVPTWKQRTFAANTVASATWIGAAALWWRKGWPNLWGPQPTASLPVGAAVSSAVIFWRFITNPLPPGSA